MSPVLPAQLRHYWPAWVTFVLGLTASAGLGWQLHREGVKLDRQRLALRVKETMDQLDGGLERTELLLRQLQDYLILSGDNRQRVFEDWCDKHGLAFNYPWLHGLAVATNRFPELWWRQLPESPEAWTAEDWAMLRNQAISQPIECRLALRSSVRERGKFLADYQFRARFPDTNRLAEAVQRQHLQMSERRTVMLDAAGNPLIGTLFYAPVYQPEMAEVLSATNWREDEKRSSARWLLMSSVILAPIDFQTLERSVWGDLAQDLGVEIFSSTNQIAETWMNGPQEGPHAADPRFQAYLTQRLAWPMYGEQFSVFFYTTPLFEAQSSRRMAWNAATAGVAMTLLAFALIGVALRARSRQEGMTGQIREARDALAAAEQQRQKLSHDLHDNTVQALYAIQLGLGHTARKLEAEPASAQGELTTASGELDAVIAELRRFILAEAGEATASDLSSVLRSLAERARIGTTARLEVRCDPEASRRLSGKQAVQLANIAREALSNSLRHAQPHLVQIALCSEPDAVRLEVSDDGIGFDPQAQTRHGVGLTSMAARASESGGSLEIQSSPGKGTRVVVRVRASLDEPAEPQWADDEEVET